MNAWVITSLASIVLAFLTSISSATAKEAPPNKASTLFRQALAADAVGDDITRDHKLTECLRVDPNFKLARWYSGQVLFGDAWKSVDTVSRLVASDPRWQEYQERLSRSGDDAQSHAALARWCHGQNLTYEEKWHWLNVLLTEPNNREALGSLGLRHYQGMLMTDEQIAEFQRQEKQVERDLKRYSKEFQQDVRAAAKGTPAERSDIVKQIAAVKDLGAISALLETMFNDPKTAEFLRSKLGTTAGEEVMQKFRLAVVAALSGMKEHQATLWLVQLAVDWPDGEISAAAANALRYRDKTSYMPLLMATLAEPVELGVSVNVLPNGKINVHEDISETGPLAESKTNRSSSYYTEERTVGNRTGSQFVPTRFLGPGGRPIVRRVLDVDISKNPHRDFTNAAVQVNNAQRAVEVENANREALNSRVQYVLQIATGEDYGSEPAAWWDAWKQYNELYTPEQLPVYQTSQVYDYSYTPTYYRTMSCFVQGTRVWTEAGPVAIETIQVGDMVLSQNPATGELDYRPVVATTVRPPCGTVKLGIGSEEIIATRGHRFWISGDGWRMAKFLQPGDRLWSVGGSVNLDTAEPAGDAKAFNLEVGQFHTYFVGHGKALVHDNTCPLPVTTLLPGVERLR